MKDPLAQLRSLVSALQAEKAKLETRLNEINSALVSISGPRSGSRMAGGKRVVSAATKAKMAAAQKARWARRKAAGLKPLKK